MNTDNYGRKINYFRFSVISECNLNCYYCSSSTDYINTDPLNLEETAFLFHALKKSGFNKVRLTGGEPCLRHELPAICHLAKTIIGSCFLTTNGVLLSDISYDLMRKGIDGINISIDSLNRDTFREITGQDELDNVLKGFYSAKKLGIPIKINTVGLKENLGEIDELVRFAKKEKVVLRIIEMMPFNSEPKESSINSKVFYERVNDILSLSKHGSLKGTSNYYETAEGQKIGFISAVSKSFCSGCNKIRISSEGEIFPCLGYSENISVRKEISGKNFSGLLEKIEGSIKLKPKEHSFKSFPSTIKMRYLGG